jgi:hypothetical protein
MHRPRHARRAVLHLQRLAQQLKRASKTPAAAVVVMVQQQQQQHH